MSTPHVVAHLDAPPTTVAVFKPAGWRVHPAGPSDVPDLVAWLTQQDLPPGTVPATRIDQPASGLVLCAATAEARRTISEWFTGHTVEKTYLALVFGHPPAEGTIQRPLYDSRRRRPLDAETRFRTVERLGPLSLVEVRPVTGRKHQLRRHLKEVGHPIVGEDRYLKRPPRKVSGFPGRLWLHCTRLTLPDGTVLSCPLPPELDAHLAHCRGLQKPAPLNT